MSTLKIPDLRA
jgi:hypothetical protein